MTHLTSQHCYAELSFNPSYPFFSFPIKALPNLRYSSYQSPYVSSTNSKFNLLALRLNKRMESICLFRISFSLKKKKNSAICDNMVESGGYCAY